MSAEGSLGRQWRSSLSPEHEAAVRGWEKHSPSMSSSDRKTFRNTVSSAPEVHTPLYRGVGSASKSGWEPLKAKHQPGATVSIGRHASASSRPEVAAGYGHVVYEMHDHHGREIGNALHEAVVPPGKYTVEHAEMRNTTAQANIDERTAYTSPRLHVRIRRQA